MTPWYLILGGGARARILAARGSEEAVGLARRTAEFARGTDCLELRADACADLAEVLRIVGQPVEAIAVREEELRLREQKGNVVGAARARAHIGELRS